MIMRGSSSYLRITMTLPIIFRGKKRPQPQSMTISSTLSRCDSVERIASPQNPPSCAATHRTRMHSDAGRGGEGRRDRGRQDIHTGGHCHAGTASRRLVPSLGPVPLTWGVGH